MGFSLSPTADTVRRSAALVLARDSSHGPEVLLLRRGERGDQNSGIWVFPGGLVDANDCDAHCVCAGLDDAKASLQLGLPEGGLDYYVAAIREAFEECGLLLAGDQEGRSIFFPDTAEDDRMQWRQAMQQNRLSLAQFCSERAWRLAAEGLAFIAHWRTPFGLPKRFDTRFFLARAPEGQVPSQDGSEMVDLRWVRPREVVAGTADINVIGPARVIIRDLSAHDSVDALVTWAQGLGQISCIQPRLAIDGRGRPGPVLPGQPAFAEIGLLDPGWLGKASSVIHPGVAVKLSPRVLRVTAPNAGPMTGPGTNSYLVGCSTDNEWSVIDPGPDDEGHVETLIKLAPGPIRRIFLTHSHPDHAMAAEKLRAVTGAALYAWTPVWPGAALPDFELQAGERLALANGVTLEAIPTPGHSSDHVCYLLVEERMLFAGDQIIQGGSPVIRIPDGDMDAYLDSLRMLHARSSEFDWIAPGHGFLLDNPQRLLIEVLKHRMAREQALLEALACRGPVCAGELLPLIYSDVPADLHAMALCTMTAHLDRLRKRKAVTETAGVWMLL